MSAQVARLIKVSAVYEQVGSADFGTNLIPTYRLKPQSGQRP
jgi:hypothetical protein